MRRMQLQLTDEQYAKVARQAEAGHRPMAAVIRDLIDHAPDDARERLLWDRALAAVGGGHSGLSDIPENHDEYLGEARW